MSPRYYRQRPWRRWLATMIGVGILCTTLPILLLRWVNPPSSSFMLQRQITAWKQGHTTFRLRYTWMDWRAISSHAVLPNPRRWHVTRPSTHVLKRRDWILRQMHRLGGTAYVRAL